MIEITTDTKLEKPLCLAMGFFDSVHVGHRKLIQTTVKLANDLGAYAGIITFSNNAYKQFNPDAKEIYTYQERMELFNELGLNICLPFRFDKYFKDLNHDEFLSLLTKTLKINAFICGYDYLFGKGGLGSSEYLAEYSFNKGIMCDIIPPIMYEGVRVSSTFIKSLLLEGKIKQANLFLGKPYFMRGTVIQGRGVGHLYGMPTANVSFGKDKLLVRQGVYATVSEIDGKRYKSVTNVGAKPTFCETSVTVESFLGDYNGDLYGKEIRLEFLNFLRPIQKFLSPEDLAKQVNKDLATSKILQT